MSQFSLEPLDRKAYIASIATLTDKKSIGFAELARDWWDRHFSWRVRGCAALTDSNGKHLCYIFYKIDRYKEYLTIHNLLTPLSHRRKGYATILLKHVFEQALRDNVSRFRLVSVPQSLPFYTSLGFAYWGINSQGDYYCDLPLPDDGLNGVETMVSTTESQDLIGTHFDTIYTKVGGNEKLLSKEQHLRFENDCTYLGHSYMHDTLMAYKKTVKTKNIT